MLSDLATGLPFSSSGAIQFFCIQTLGIILEDFVQHLYHLAGFKSGVFSRVLGFVWVIGFLLFWSSPVWHFPQVYTAAQRSEEEKRIFGRMVPIPVLGRILGKLG